METRSSRGVQVNRMKLFVPAIFLISLFCLADAGDIFIVESENLATETSRILSPLLSIRPLRRYEKGLYPFQDTPLLAARIDRGFLVEKIIFRFNEDYFRQPFCFGKPSGAMLYVLPSRSYSNRHVAQESEKCALQHIYSNETMNAFIRYPRSDTLYESFFSFMSFMLALHLDGNRLIEDRTFLDTSVSIPEMVKHYFKSRQGIEPVESMDSASLWCMLLGDFDATNKVRALCILLDRGDKEDIQILEKWEQTKKAPDINRETTRGHWP